VTANAHAEVSATIITEQMVGHFDALANKAMLRLTFSSVK
jgi:hypothetical protein